MIYVVAAVAVLMAVCTVAFSFQLMQMKKLLDVQMRHAEKTDEHIASLVTVVADLQKEPEDVTARIENYINEAREKVFTQWVDDVVNYDPYNKESK